MLPVTDPAGRARIAEILEANLTDDTLAWELGPDGRWTKVQRAVGMNTHTALRDAALQRGRAEPDV